DWPPAIESCARRPSPWHPGRRSSRKAPETGSRPALPRVLTHGEHERGGSMTDAPAELEKVSRVCQKGKERVEGRPGRDLVIPKGDFLALMGPPGSGKSTRLNRLGGLGKPTSGSIRIGRVELATMSNAQLAKWRAHHVGFMLQFYS